jgi:hypothetical protein
MKITLPASEMRKPMSAGRRIILLVLAVLIAGIYYHVFSTVGFPVYPHGPEWDTTVRALRSVPRERAHSAIEAFAGNQRVLGRAVPEMVPLDELVAQGFLRPDEVALFGGMNVTFCTDVDESGRPGQTFALVHLTNGHVYAEAADGAISPVGGRFNR